jgi:hypothetical protein
MTRGWAKSLLFNIAIGAIVLFTLLCSVQSLSAYEVSPSHRDVGFSFGQFVYNTDTVSFTITNNQNSTVRGNINIPATPAHITIIGPSSFTCPPKSSTSVQFTITASPSSSGEDETRTFTIDMGGKPVVVSVTITYYALLEVSPPSIDFGRVRRTDKPQETVTIRETLGYKDVNIRIEKKTGNDWLKTDKTQIQMKKGSAAKINFTLTPGTPDHNRYSWSYSLSSTTSNTEISPSSTIQIEAYILMPAKLGELDDEELEIKFDKPRGTEPEYEGSIYVRVTNEGDEKMEFSSKITEPREIDMKIISVHSGLIEVDGKGDEDLGIQITAPYYASEGTHHGKLKIDAGAAGQETVDIAIKIIWPVDFKISSESDYFWPAEPAIDFGPLELKEQGYEKREMNLTITETYLYKPVRNLRLFPKGEYGKLWIKDVQHFSVIPPGESRNITVKIEPGLEAVPKDYSWNCDLSASEIEAKRIEVKAKIVPMNISMMVDEFRSFRNGPLYTRYPSTEDIISNGVELLEIVEESEIKAVDWKRIPILTKGALALLSSLNGAIVFTEEKAYGKAVENLLIASVSLSSVDSNSDMYNRDLSNYAHAVSTGADMTTEAVLKDEAKMLELRGWDIKNAVEHAIAKDDIHGLKAEENVLNSSLSYQHAATVYGLLSDKEKRLECAYEESMLMDKHDELVTAANDLRFDAENMIFDGKEKDLVRIWDLYLLLNPYGYDTASANYWLAQRKLDDASKKYVFAGERLMAKNTIADSAKLKGEWSRILWLFILVCLLYVAVLGYIIIRILMGTMAYMRDMRDREVGDIVVT